MAKMAKLMVKVAAGLLAGGLLLATPAVLVLWQAPKLTPVRQVMAAPAQQDLALVGVTVLNPGEPEQPARTVLIRAGRIVAIQAATDTVPAGYRHIDGNGQWLMPGLIDLHAHLFDETDLTLLLAHGVTSARNMMGKPFHLQARAAVERGELAGTRLFTASPTLNGEGAPLHQVIDTPEAARQAVRDSKRQGFDFIKVYDGLSAEVFAAVVDEARQLQLSVAGHPPRSIPLADSVAAMISIEHAEELWQHGLNKADDAAVDALIQQFLAHDTTLVPTLQIVQQLVDVCGAGATAITDRDSPLLNPLIAYLGRQSVGEWADGSDGCDKWAASVQRMGALTRRFADAGVRVVVGSDNGPHLSLAGAATLRELHQLHAIGLTTDKVLAAATRDAATVLGKADTLGRIAEGYAADALLLAQDPRKDLTALDQPTAIIAQGRWYDAAARDALFAASRQHAGWWLTAGRLVETP